MELFKKNFIDVILQKYIAFEGRADRAEFWYFTLFNFIFSIVLSFIFPVSLIYVLAVLCPSLAVATRRLRDAGFSPWWLLCCIVGAAIIPLIMCAFPSKATSAE